MCGGLPPRTAPPHRPQRSCRAPCKAWQAVARSTAPRDQAASTHGPNAAPPASTARRRRQPLKEGRRLGARRLAAQRHLFARVDAMKLKETLGRVHANARSLFTGGSSPMKSLVSLIMAHGCRSGAVHPRGGSGSPRPLIAASPGLRPGGVRADDSIRTQRILKHRFNTVDRCIIVVSSCRKMRLSN